MNKSIFVVLLILILAGCAAVQNTREAKLMPEEVAKKILIKFAGEEWVNNPYGYYGGSNTSKKVSMPYSKIVQVDILIPSMLRLRRSKVQMWDSTEYRLMKPDNSRFSEQEINDIVDALVSLGANLPEAKKISK